MKKVTYGLIIITIMLFLGLGLFQSPLLASTENGMESAEDILLNITTISKNQYFMVKSIVVDKHNVEYLSENEKEIYDFKYNEDTINNISERDLFIYSGINNEPWINDFIEKLEKGDLGIININRGIKTLTYENDGGKENPYYWLGVNEYKIDLYNIKCAIQEKDPKNKNYYEENYLKVIGEIDESILYYITELEKHKDYTILTDTSTFDYLLDDLGLQIIKVKEPITAKFLKEKNIDKNKVIFIKEKDPIDFINEIENKNKVLKIEENKKIAEEQVETEKPLEINTIELIRWDEEKTSIDIVVSNIKIISEALNNLPKK